jgi:hypothetical protein
VVRLVNDHHVVGRAFQVFEDFLLFQKINRSETKRNVVKGDRAKFGAAPHFVECLPVNNAETQTKAMGHFHFPLGKQRAGR